MNYLQNKRMKRPTTDKEKHMKHLKIIDLIKD